jgi:hypothetical protein
MSLRTFLVLLFLQFNLSGFSQSNDVLLIQGVSEDNGRVPALITIELLAKGLTNYDTKLPSFREVINTNDFTQGSEDLAKLQELKRGLVGQSISIDAGTSKDLSKNLCKARYILTVYTKKIGDDYYQFDFILSCIAIDTSCSNLKVESVEKGSIGINFEKDSDEDPGSKGKLIYESKLENVLRKLTEFTTAAPQIGLYVDQNKVNFSQKTKISVELNKQIYVDASTTFDEDTRRDGLLFYWDYVGNKRVEYSSSGTQQLMTFKDTGDYRIALTVSDRSNENVSESFIISVKQRPKLYTDITRKHITRQQSLYSLIKPGIVAYKGKLDVDLQNASSNSEVALDFHVFDYDPREVSLYEVSLSENTANSPKYNDISSKFDDSTITKATSYTVEYTALLSKGDYTLVVIPKVKGSDMQGDSLIVPLRYRQRPLGYLSIGYCHRSFTNNTDKTNFRGGNLNTVTGGIDIYLAGGVKARIHTIGPNFGLDLFPDETLSTYEFGMHYALQYDNLFQTIAKRGYKRDRTYPGMNIDFLLGVHYDVHYLRYLEYRKAKSVGFSYGFKYKFQDAYLADLFFLAEFDWGIGSNPVNSTNLKFGVSIPMWN